MTYTTRGKTTPVEWQEWAQNPATLEFLGWLEAAREDTKEAWSKEQFVGKTDSETLAANATALGGVRVLDQVMEKVEALKQWGEL